MVFLRAQFRTVTVRSPPSQLNGLKWHGTAAAGCRGGAVKRRGPILSYQAHRTMQGERGIALPDGASSCNLLRDNPMCAHALRETAPNPPDHPLVKGHPGDHDGDQEA